jgi:serine/threonine protein kinase
VHRDLKLENILLNEEKSIDSGLRLIDFGIAGKL